MDIMRADVLLQTQFPALSPINCNVHFFGMQVHFLDIIVIIIIIYLLRNEDTAQCKTKD